MTPPAYPGGSYENRSPERRLRILVADDAAGVRAALGAGLRAHGYQVQTANEGVQALALHVKEPFDAVVTDFVMPGGGGRELAVAVKRLNPSTPVILVTGSINDLGDAPFDLVIMKPLRMEVLHAALQRFCQ